MADFQFIDFALMAGLVRKEMQFRLPDNFSNIDVTKLSWTSHPTSGFSIVFHKTDGPLFGNWQNVLHNKGKARSINIAYLRGRHRHFRLVTLVR